MRFTGNSGRATWPRWVMCFETQEISKDYHAYTAQQPSPTMGPASPSIRRPEDPPIPTIPDFHNPFGDLPTCEIVILQTPHGITLFARKIFNFNDGQFTNSIRHFRIAPGTINLPSRLRHTPSTFPQRFYFTLSATTKHDSLPWHGWVNYLFILEMERLLAEARHLLAPSLSDAFRHFQMAFSVVVVIQFDADAFRQCFGRREECVHGGLFFGGEFREFLGLLV